ncbi:hypothetical protein JCM1840_000201 [Sporobolomyces johnsonii]
MATPEEQPTPAADDKAPSVQEPTTDRSPAVTAHAHPPDAAADATPPPAATEVPAAPPTAALAAPPANPKVAQLRALFPSTSDDILEAVLDAHGGDLDQASQTLLDMNDPEFKSSPSTDNDLSQLDLDAELARQLAREDDLHAHAQQQTRQQRRQTAPPSTSTQREQRAPLSYQAYVPKSRRVQQQKGGPAGAGMGSWAPPAAQQQRQRQLSEEDDKDELDVLAENFSKLAEQGKKSFGSFMSKMKQQVGKLDEMIQQSASPSTTASASGQPPAPPPKSHSVRSGGTWSAPSPLPRPADAPARSASPSFVPELLPRPSSSTSSRTQTPSPSRATFNVPSTSAAAASSSTLSAPAPAQADITSKDLPFTSSSPAPPGQAAAPVDPRKDFSRIGLLPRRSVSLLDDDTKVPSTSSGSSREKVRSPLSAPGDKEDKAGEDDGDDGDSDDLEYVRNPFDED